MLALALGTDLLEPVLAAGEAPRPTQNAAYVEPLAGQLTAGCAQVAFTSVNVDPLTA